MTLVHHLLGFVRAVLRASFPTFHRWIEQGSLWRILRAALRVLAVTVAAIVVMLAAEIAGAFVDQAAVSQTAVAAAKSLAVRVIPFLPHSNEGGRLLVGGNLFIESGEDGLWPGFARARIFERAKWDFTKCACLTHHGCVEFSIGSNRLGCIREPRLAGPM